MEQEKELTVFKINHILSLIQNMNNESERRIKQLLSLSDGLQHVRENSIHKQPYTVNVFEFYNSYEPVTSWFLGEILKFRLNNDPIFIKSFIKHFLDRKSGV